MEDFIFEFIQQLPLDTYLAVGLTGSYASGQATKWSDVDIVVITDERVENYIEVYQDKYFTVNFYALEELESYFKDPLLILSSLKALSHLRPLYDPDHILEKLKSRGQAFKLGSVVKEHARYRAKKEYIAYIEEAQKGIQGIKDHHIGKMINGLYGLTHGMFTVIRLRDQLQISSDNEFYDVVIRSLSDKDPIKELAPLAFGLSKGQLEDCVEAGLEIFIHVGNSLMDMFSETEKAYVLKLIHEIIMVV